MDKFINSIKSLSWQQILSTAVLVAALVAATFYFSSCNVARSTVSGNRVVDKNVKDSTHYEVTLEK